MTNRLPGAARILSLADHDFRISEQPPARTPNVASLVHCFLSPQCIIKADTQPIGDRT
jgi:hypothetical protein